MASLLQRRLRCFYCGQRSASKKSTALREWRCEHCEAMNYLDENGEITDPPTTVTNGFNDPTDTAQAPFESVGFDQTGLFCSKCVRNQHLLMKVLGSYLPDSDDPTYPAFEREYPRFRRNMEERYPQVCENCEQRVNHRIRQTGYEAKADHLRRTMERSKISRASKKARRRNWRSILAMMGAFGYWTSVAGQLTSDVIGTYDMWNNVAEWGLSSFIMTYLSYMKEMVSSAGYSPEDLAGIALIIGALSIWWNPKVHLKVEGLNGRILGLNQYYECQLIVMVTRFGVWALLKDTSGMKPTLPPAIHAVMILFMSAATVFSQRLVHYDTRPLVLWSNTTPVASPHPQRTVPQLGPSTMQKITSHQPESFHPFPVEKLGMPRETPKPNVMRPITPQREMEDSMDWTPSVAQEIRPKFVNSVKSEAISSVVPETSLFQGILPAAPRPPAWQIRNPISQRPPQTVPETNIFNMSSTISQNPAGDIQNQDISRASDAIFAPPKFFAPSDYHATTGLENLFDHAFTIKSPEDNDMDKGATLRSTVKGTHKEYSRSTLLYTSIRLSLLSACLFLWSIDWMRLALIPRDGILMGTLIMNILLTGFALLASLNQHSIIIQRVIYSLIKFVTTVVLALCLGYNFSITFYQDGNLELCVKCVTALLAVEEVLGLISGFPATKTQKHNSRRKTEAPAQHAIEETRLIPQTQHLTPPPSSPSLSYMSKQPISAFSQSSFSSQSQYPTHGYGLYQRDMSQNHHHYHHHHILDDGSDASDMSAADSDAETTITSYTNKSIRNMNPFGGDDSRNPPPTPQGPGLGSGIMGLSLDDSPVSRRVTRSQTVRNTERNHYSRKLR